MILEGQPPRGVTPDGIWKDYYIAESESCLKNDTNVLLQSILHISRPLLSTNGMSCSGIKLLITMPSAFAFSQNPSKVEHIFDRMEIFQY